VKRVFATKGSDLEKTNFGNGASLLGSLDAAVDTDVIVIDSDWSRPKISGIDLLVNSPGLAWPTCFPDHCSRIIAGRLLLLRKTPENCQRRG